MYIVKTLASDKVCNPSVNLVQLTGRWTSLQFELSAVKCSPFKCKVRRGVMLVLSQLQVQLRHPFVEAPGCV